jgi:hypothetical protein
MHKMKEEVFQRILAQELLKSELWLRIYVLWKLLGAKRSFHGGSRVLSEILGVAGGSWHKR